MLSLEKLFKKLTGGLPLTYREIKKKILIEYKKDSRNHRRTSNYSK